MGIKGEGEVSGGLGLGFLSFRMIDAIIIAGVKYAPPGAMSSITPMSIGTHQCLTSPFWFWVSPSGIGV